MNSAGQLRILVTNDDGIYAPGLKALERIARAISRDVWVVAPETEQSGAGHSLTLHVPVRVRRISARRFAVNGTPTDCVMLALQEIIPARRRVDLVVSGVNRGSNVGDDVTYSGTIAAAMEGTILGVPSIAFSQHYDDREKMPWATAETFSPDLIRRLMKVGWPSNTMININFPACLPRGVKGIDCAPQGKRLVSVGLSERMDLKGRPYYWIGGARDDKADRPGVDVDRLNEGYITVTPLCLDLTDYKTMAQMREALG